MKRTKILEKILSGSKNISFTDFVNLIEGYGFELARTKGSHQIFKHKEIAEIVNLQNSDGHVKPYQIKQFLELVEKYNLILEE